MGARSLGGDSMDAQLWVVQSFIAPSLRYGKNSSLEQGLRGLTDDAVHAAPAAPYRIGNPI